MAATLSASRDDTLYEPQGSEEHNNGAGEWFFVGQAGGRDVRRSLIGFDIAAGVRDGSTVVRAFLKLNMSRTIADDSEIRMHRVLSDWQEGQGIGFGNEGSGDAAAADDVSWTHRVFDTID